MSFRGIAWNGPGETKGEGEHAWDGHRDGSLGQDSGIVSLEPTDQAAEGKSKLMILTTKLKPDTWWEDSESRTIQRAQFCVSELTPYSRRQSMAASRHVPGRDPGVKPSARCIHFFPQEPLSTLSPLKLVGPKIRAREIDMAQLMERLLPNLPEFGLT